MAKPYFRTAPCDVKFVGGDPATLLKIEALEFSISGDRRLADLLNDSLVQRETDVLGLNSLPTF